MKLMMLLKSILPSCKCRGRHNKPVPIESLCDLWMQDQLSDLWSKALSRASSTNKQHRTKDVSLKQVTSAISLAQDGLYSKACQTLVSPGLAPNNEETWRLLETKHPKSECPTAPIPSDTSTSIPLEINLMAILRSFLKLTAAGISGLRIQHLIDAAEVPLQTPILHSLRAVVNLLAAGKAPVEITAYLAGGNLTALNKSKPGCPFDVQPIAVGEALRQLVGKCLCASVKVKSSAVF